MHILTGSSLKIHFFKFTLKLPSVQGLIVLILVEALSPSSHRSATGQGEGPFITVTVVPIALVLILFKCYATNNVNITFEEG